MFKQHHRSAMNPFLNGTKNHDVDGMCKQSLILVVLYVVKITSIGFFIYAVQMTKDVSGMTVSSGKHSRTMTTSSCPTVHIPLVEKHQQILFTQQSTANKVKHTNSPKISGSRQRARLHCDVSSDICVTTLLRFLNKPSDHSKNGLQR